MFVNGSSYIHFKSIFCMPCSLCFLNSKMVLLTRVLWYVTNVLIHFDFRKRLHDLFGQIEKEFENLYAENLACKSFTVQANCIIYAVFFHTCTIHIYKLNISYSIVLVWVCFFKRTMTLIVLILLQLYIIAAILCVINGFFFLLPPLMFCFLPFKCCIHF